MNNIKFVTLTFLALIFLIYNFQIFAKEKQNRPKVSVIIPLAPGESIYKPLIQALKTLPNNTEILFITNNQDAVNIKNSLQFKENVQIITAPPGRAEHMNSGARVATGKYLWFLHADSRFQQTSYNVLCKYLNHNPDSLLFFDLAFLNDATPLMQLNEWGALFRSRALGVPFGDQGFCIKKTIFNKLGGFPENLPYGEDHVFVWRARQNGINLQPLDAKIYTSARKYQKNGWFKTTILTQYLWIKQALPEWKRLKNSIKIS